LELINSISSDDIKFTTLEDTKDGVSDTTYILTDSNNKRYICKLYESASLAEVKRERRLLSLLHGSFCVPSPMFELCKYKNRPLAFYSFIEGKSPQKPNTNQIKKIAKFLARFHTISPKIGRSSEGFYTHKSMKKMLQDAPFEFQKRYKLIKNIPLFCDGLIHGDLFPDNSKFIGDELIGVFDFIDSSVGDFSFDLAVVANSWCENDINTLLDSYNSFAPKSVSKNSLLNMMKFAALFYALQRLHSGTKDYREYLAKFDFINN
jgi:homoserine kinase type II